MAYGFNDDKSKRAVYGKDEVYSKSQTDSLLATKIAERTSQIGAAVASGYTYYSASFFFPEAPTSDTEFTKKQLRNYAKDHFVGIGELKVMTAPSNGNMLSFPICGWEFVSAQRQTGYGINLKVYFANVTTPISTDWTAIAHIIYK